MFGKKNKTKVKVKTAKGGGPIRKLKFAIGAGTVAALLKSVFGDAIDASLVGPISEFVVESVDLAVALGTFYLTSPGEDDGVEVEAG